MRFLTWLPDSLYLRLLYYGELGRWLNLSNPKRFTEKIQWLKLHDRRPEYTMMVDKYAVKDYVAAKIGAEFIIPTLGIWNSFDDIDFKSLPDKFVLKTTHGGGSGGVVICSDKSAFDMGKARTKLEESLRSDIYTNYREWPYKNVPRRIIAEQFIEVPFNKDLPDYKIFCFNGTPRYIQVIKDRNTDESIDFFDTEWNHQPFYGLNPNVHPSTHDIPKPANLEDMLKIACHLAKNIDFVRVDLYQTTDKVYFGELTFYPASGMGVFNPDKWDLTLGEFINL